MRSRLPAAAVVVLALLGAGSAEASFPGRDGRIAFFAQVGCNRYSGPGDPCAAQAYSAIVTLAPGGGHTSRLARCPGPQCVPGIGQHPVWSPDGALLAVEVIGDEGASDVAILSAGGALVRRLAVRGYPLSWLPGGRRLAVLGARRVVTVAATGGPSRAVGGPRGPRTWSVRGDVAIEHGAGSWCRAPPGIDGGWCSRPVRASGSGARTGRRTAAGSRSRAPTCAPG
jgi:hypothetical protein